MNNLYNRIKELASQVEGGNIVLDETGFYNFEILEVLLNRNSFMTSKYERLISTLKCIFRGDEQEREEKLQDSSRRLEHIAGVDNSYNEEYAGMIGLLRDVIVVPSCEHTLKWLEWTKLLEDKVNKNEKFTIISEDMSGGWQLKFAGWYVGLQVYKDLAQDTFLSILGPRLNWGGSSCPIFEYFLFDGKNNSGMIFPSYTKTSTTIREQHLIELPTEDQIQQSIDDFLKVNTKK